MQRLGVQLSGCEQQVSALPGQLDALRRALRIDDADADTKNTVTVEEESARLEQDLHCVQRRFQDAHGQLEVRLSQLSDCLDLFNNYRLKAKPLLKWMSGVQARVSQTSTDNAQIQSHAALRFQREQLDQCMALLEEMVKVRPDMEELHQRGCRLIKASKVSVSC